MDGAETAVRACIAARSATDAAAVRALRSPGCVVQRRVAPLVPRRSVSTIVQQRLRQQGCMQSEAGRGRQPSMPPS